MEFITTTLREFKLEILFIFLFVFAPLIFLLVYNFKNFEKFIFFMTNYLTSKNPQWENISLTKDVTIFKGSIFSNNIHLGDIFGIVYFFLTLFKKEYRKYFSLIPNGTIPLLFYSLLSSLSVINAPERTIDRSIFAITMHLRQFLFFYCFANYFRIEGRIDFQLKSFYFIACYTFLVALQQRYSWGLMRVSGDFTHPNGMVFYLCPIIGIFTAILFNIKENNYNKTIAISAILMCLFSCLMSMSRGFLVNCGVTLVVLILVDFSIKFELKKPLLLIGFILILLFGSIKAWDSWYERLTVGKNDTGTAQRQAYYLMGLEVLREYKWFGIGINQFGSNAYQIGIIERVLDYDFIKNDPIKRSFIFSYKRIIESGIKSGIDEELLNKGGTPESFYVLHFAETGISGIIGTLFCQLFFLFSALRSIFYFRKRNMFFYSISVGLFSSLAGVYTQSIFEFILRQENPMYLQAYLYAMVSSIAYLRRSKKFHNIDSIENGQIKNAIDLPPLPTI